MKSNSHQAFKLTLILQQHSLPRLHYIFQILLYFFGNVCYCLCFLCSIFILYIFLSYEYTTGITKTFWNKKKTHKQKKNKQKCKCTLSEFRLIYHICEGVWKLQHSTKQADLNQNWLDTQSLTHELEQDVYSVCSNLNIFTSVRKTQASTTHASFIEALSLSASCFDQNSVALVHYA